MLMYRTFIFKAVENCEKTFFKRIFSEALAPQ